MIALSKTDVADVPRASTQNPANICPILGICLPILLTSIRQIQ